MYVDEWDEYLELLELLQTQGKEKHNEESRFYKNCWSSSNNN